MSAFWTCDALESPVGIFRVTSRSCKPTNGLRRHLQVTHRCLAAESGAIGTYESPMGTILGELRCGSRKPVDMRAARWSNCVIVLTATRAAGSSTQTSCV